MISNLEFFYRIAEKARSNYENSKEENIEKLNFESALDKLVEELEENPDMKFPMKTEGKDFQILGFTEKSIQFKKASGGTGHTLSKKTHKDYYYDKLPIPTEGLGIYYPPVVKKLQSYESNKNKNVMLENFVIIIDEINRGNISQIFGELITLIEDDKRLGKEEALEVILPYSKEPFSVPPNLYIIGTMNTADRSVEALDTALRRRFSFQEMPPKPELIRTDGKSKDTNGVIEDIDLVELLTTINRRIEMLLDRDHLVGHSYFMDVDSIEGLKIVFQDKIIPLLQEYFYSDYSKMGLILGEGFVTSNTDKEKPFPFFASFENDYQYDYIDKKIYRIAYLDSVSNEEFQGRSLI